MNAVFVYGLLKPGFSLHHVVASFVVESTRGQVRGRLYDAGVPAARFDEDGEIEGFVLWLDEQRSNQALLVLDELEDEGIEYRRVIIEVTTAGGSVSAHAYHYLGSVDGCRDVGRWWS